MTAHRTGVALAAGMLALAAGMLALAAGMLALAGTPAALAAQGPPPSAAALARERAFVDSVLRGLTLEEKLGQLNQPGVEGVIPTGPQQRTAGEDAVRAGRVGSFLSINGAAATRRLQRVAVEESRARIPLLFGNDVIHGHRTIGPIPLAEAASWDTALVERTARLAAEEAAGWGINWTYAPMVDVTRDPRWGRIMEGSGEDAFLGSAMAAARVRGFQGRDLRDSLTLLATAKHFVAYGAAEGGRDYNVAGVSERTLLEHYLPPFRAALRAGAGSIMAAFNEVNGVPMHANARLIDGLLRRRWGWDGLLVSDYTGVTELMPHGVAGDTAAAARLAIEAGVDIDMVSHAYVGALPALVRAGTVPEARVDDAVRRVLVAKYRLGLFEDPYRYSDTTRQRRLTLRPEHLAGVRAMARRSIVLLRNAPHAGRPVLPLRKDLRTLAVIGPLADDSVSSLGEWAAIGRPEEVVTALAGIRAAVSPGTRVLHARGAAHDGADTSGFAEAVRVAAQADAVVLVLGEHRALSGEARSRTSLDLPGVQQQLLQRVHATGKPIALVLMAGRPLSVEWAADSVPAIAMAWYLGLQTGPALADVLFGDESPSGKLPVTVPRNVGQIPLYHGHVRTGRPPDPAIPWPRHQYTSKYMDVDWTPLYPFGHGLSYTTFAYDAPRPAAAEIAPTDTLVVRVDVTNTGRVAGDEVVQLYLRDSVASVTRPLLMLRGFQRVRLAPGERRTLTFVLRPDDLALYDAALRRVVEPGDFVVLVGGSSAALRSATFRVTGAVTPLPEEAIR